MFISRIAHQVTAFSLAAVLTLGILGSINVLAEQPAPHAAMQMAAATSQAHS